MNQTIVVSAGCFWGVEELIRAVPGVIDTEVGYAGGEADTARYEFVKTGKTGHAEAVQITFDDSVLSLKQVFELFFKLHDPTTLDQQGNDRGSQYRSSIFVKSPTEREAAQTAIEQASASGRYSRPVVTKIEELKSFSPAETYHQDYLRKNPNGYTCHYWRE